MAIGKVRTGLYGVIAEFTSPAELVTAAEAARCMLTILLLVRIAWMPYSHCCANMTSPWTLGQTPEGKVAVKSHRLSRRVSLK